MARTAFVDTSNAPEFFAHELHDCELFGAVCRLVPVAYRKNASGMFVAEAPCTLVLPTTIVAGAARLILKRLEGGGAH
ncbi:hypothetical protein [Bradyrhizobium sp.]|uniref:hypothetical protein n=1 Tax=Bradyrhizobium sp. TaxID=376 RepID=UPI0025C52EB1|nr:hypothetical protein [Bradyrhizobium sp.]